MTYTIYSKINCPNCVIAKSILASKGLEVNELILDKDYTRNDLLLKIPEVRSLPQIFCDNDLIGGLEQLKRYLQ